MLLQEDVCCVVKVANSIMDLDMLAKLVAHWAVRKMDLTAEATMGENISVG